MGKKAALLSTEVSRARAQILGGAPAPSALTVLREWQLAAPSGVSPDAMGWSVRLASAIREGLPLGAPVGRLLRAVQPFIRSDEKRWARLQGVERQFAFQGAVAAVVPWAAAALTGHLDANALTISGAVLQTIGLAVFAFMVRRVCRPAKSRDGRLFELALGVWIRVLSGLSVRSALENALSAEPPGSELKSVWLRWLEARDTGIDALAFEWPPGFDRSCELGTILGGIMKSGSPAGEILADMIDQLDDERQSALDERLQGLPSRVSLVFCATIVPAVFLVLMGGLWPTLESSWT